MYPLSSTAVRRCSIAFALGASLNSCAGTRTEHARRLAVWEEVRDERYPGGSEGSADPAPLVWSDGASASGQACLELLLEYARANNPGLEAAFRRWKAAIENIPQASKLPEPRVTFSAYLEEVETRVGPMQARIGLTQRLPWFGERQLAGDVEFEASEAAREQLEAARLDLDQRVRTAWYEYAWLERARQITEGNLELLAHWEGVARSRMETGLGRQSDVIRAQVELGKLDDRVASLRDLRGPLMAQLNAELNRDSDAALPRPTFPLAEPRPIDGQSLARALSDTSPVLRALEHRALAAGHATSLAEKAFYPDLSVGLDYTFVGTASSPGVSGSGDDAVALTLGLGLPIWRGSYRAGLRRAEAQLKGVRLEQVALANRLAADLQMALYRFRDGDRRLGLFRDSLVPKGEQSVQSLDIAYQSGEQGFLDLIDAQRVLLEFQLQAARAEVDRAEALAEIERITAVPVHSESNR